MVQNIIQHQHSSIFSKVIGLSIFDLEHVANFHKFETPLFFGNNLFMC